MLVLHGFWSNSGGMRLWAEDSDLLVKSPSQALRSARPHPFAAPADLIAGIHPGKPATAVLLLPSLRSAPLDSPELIRLAPRPAARTDPMLLAWTVPVVDLDPTAALAAFDQPAPDVRYGASDHAEQVAQPLTDCLDRYYARQADINVPSPPATPSTALLDQLPDTGLSARGRPLTELLRPAYHALTHHHNSAGG